MMDREYGPYGPQGPWAHKKKRKEGPGGRKDRADEPGGRTGRKDRPGGRTDRADGIPHPPKNHENQMFLRTLKRCASKFCEGSTEQELQIIDMELLGANSVFEKV